MLPPGSLLNLEWYKSADGREMINSLMYKNSHKRKAFGLLEKPQYGLSVEEFQYKIFLVGKSGVGKTCTLAKLSGNEIPSSHCETAGIQTCVVHWPVKISRLDKTVMFQLNLWDAGENALKKFDHVLPACMEKTDAYLFLFSFVDKSSFDDLPGHISRMTTVNDNSAKLVLGTKFDQYAHSEINQRDIRDFERQWNIPVLKIRNVPVEPQSDGRVDLGDVVPILNALCEHLWHRDIEMARHT